MGMLLHNTLMEQERLRKETKPEKPVEVPKENEPEPVRKAGRRKTTSK